MKKFIILLSSLFALTANADSSFFNFGLGIANSAKTSRGETKVGALGYRSDLFDGIYWQYKVGFYGDGSGDETRKSSAFAFTGPGMLIDFKPIEIRAGWGLGGIATPDSYLGGRFPQFNGEVYLGVRDHRGNGIGLGYEHISSAGLVTPNQGRDFFVLQLSQQW